ncbi:hypothetical protein FZEAL_2908 [Fusarium zealandicum]|uniref:Uncharacterized protein n=1 Tax=Fusarium zealandicum TaxID=1053134 RepID=A0A8H4UPV7_9HYPO|nr:hypothetical protein FZEAL_2908 [Fusarium zealandicum]
MRLSQVGQAVFCGLAAIVTADVLPPDDIPLMCVTICGPIVELTSKCDIHGQKLTKRGLAWVQKLAVEPPEMGPLRVEPRQEAEKRSFSIIRAAPTSFPPEAEAAATVPSDPSSTTRSSRITAVADQSSPLTTTLASTSGTQILPRTTRASLGVTDTATSRTGREHNYSKQSDSSYSHNDPEQECVCLNTSFDVAKVAALCHGCIIVDGHKRNNMDVIMEGCNFTTMAYTPDQDKVVNNIRVEATQLATSTATQGQVANAGNCISTTLNFWAVLMGVFLVLSMVI